MDVAWIPVFVLTLSECVAPTGKTVCQESQYELQFLTQADCDKALAELIALKEESKNVIVNAEGSYCAPSARQQSIYASLDAVTDAHRGATGWRAPEAEETRPAPSRAEHEVRLAELKTCEETGHKTPCKIGEIIIEGEAAKEIKVWKKDN